MLSDNEINDYYDSVYTHFISKNQNRIRMEDNLLRGNCLVNHDFRLIGIAKHPMTVKSLSNISHFPQYTFFMTNQDNYNLWVEINKSWMFAHDVNKKTWTTSEPIHSIDDLKEYILMNQKVALLDAIHNKMEHFRSDCVKLLEGQSSIYICKYIEAKEILENNVLEDRLMKYPFTNGYSRTKGISLTQSAKEIVLQHQMQSGALAESENIRIKFTNMVRGEKNVANLLHILENFEIESYRYSAI